MSRQPHNLEEDVLIDEIVKWRRTPIHQGICLPTLGIDSFPTAEAALDQVTCGRAGTREAILPMRLSERT